ncbi:1-aminocyclopropane-1-carboxylate deaminase/D-cysteine desulfhydrase [Aurantibacillus circumpalustris]|uniref:1-aminocyclopropane-1-carboxylate deaminase/D-cysteine desulfhydrase n=1 Tax=Aurantibacillus circumpalustris TaxID=3036359 RepID=UPI00295BAD62|nr:pyridoxal-phosphate dependent enzyme [Aurantibacillus circumpalustris]
MISYNPIIQELHKESAYQVDVLRLDLIDVEISGNKWFKLKNNLEKAISQNKKSIITFGGAYSNHIAATAAACKKFNLKCIGVIRGEEKEELNDTLKTAQKNGMEFYFVDRETYKQKDTIEFKNNLAKTFGEHYLIPEGGNNEEGVSGCMDILKKEWNYDYVFCACGTATTFAGILTSAKDQNKIIGISVLKGENNLPAEAEVLLDKISLNSSKMKILGEEALKKDFIEDSCILNSYAFKGYAKKNTELLNFKTEFENKFEIPLDHIYTTKLFYAVFDLIKRKKLISDSKILVVHSGGLQGNEAFEKRYHLTPNL